MSFGPSHDGCTFADGAGECCGAKIVFSVIVRLSYDRLKFDSRALTVGECYSKKGVMQLANLLPK